MIQYTFTLIHSCSAIISIYILDQAGCFSYKIVYLHHSFVYVYVTSVNREKLLRFHRLVVTMSEKG